MRLLGDMLRVDPVAWSSPHSLPETIERLRSVGLTGTRSLFAYTGAPLCGRIHDDRVTATKRTFTNNSWAPVFVGRLSMSPLGVELRGEIRVHRFTRVFMTLWLAVTSLVAIGGVVMAFSGSPGALIALAFPVWGVLLTNVGARLGRSHWDFIRTTIRDAVDGVEILHERALT